MANDKFLRKHRGEIFSPHPDLGAGFRELAPAILMTKATILFQEGRPAEGVFMLESGKARLSLRSVRGRRLTFRIVGPGYLLGLAPTILGKPYIFTAELLEDSSVFFIARPEVLRLLREHSGRCFDVLQQLSSELAEMPPTIVPVQTRRRASAVSGSRR